MRFYFNLAKPDSINILRHMNLIKSDKKSVYTK